MALNLCKVFVAGELGGPRPSVCLWGALLQPPQTAFPLLRTPVRLLLMLGVREKDGALARPDLTSHLRAPDYKGKGLLSERSACPPTSTSPVALSLTEAQLLGPLFLQKTSRPDRAEPTPTPAPVP